MSSDASYGTLVGKFATPLAQDGRQVPNYWFDVFTPATWEEAASAGFAVSGFSTNKRATVKRVQINDVLICYLKGSKKLIGALKVLGPSYFAHEPAIRASQPFPVKLPVKPISVLTTDTAVDFEEVLKHLSFYNEKNLRSTWARLQGSPTQLADGDGEALLSAILAISAAVPDEEPVESLSSNMAPELVIGHSVNGIDEPTENVPSAKLAIVDPVEMLITELIAAQRDTSKPSRFEQSVAEVLSYLGFESQWLGKQGTTDVVIDSPLGHDRFRAIIDTKATASGKVSESQINWPAIRDHQTTVSANYAAIVGEKFADGNLIKHAKEYDIALIDTESLVAVLRLHNATPFVAADLRQLFSTPESLPTIVADLHQKAESSLRHWLLVADVLRLVDGFSRTDPPLTPTVGSLHASLVAMTLASTINKAAPPSENDVREAVAFLSCRAVGILRPVEPEVGGYRLSMSVVAATQRLAALERTVVQSIRSGSQGNARSQTITAAP